MPGFSRRCGDQLQPERFEPQKYLRVHQRAGMDAEDFHAGRALWLGKPKRDCVVEPVLGRRVAPTRGLAPGFAAGLATTVSGCHCEERQRRSDLGGTRLRYSASAAAWRCRSESCPGPWRIAECA